jgi:hypothetical protein
VIALESNSPQAPQLISDLPRMLEVAGHFRLVPFFLSTSMFGGLPFEIAGGDISQLVDKPVADTHTHEFPEIYLLLSPNPGGAEIDIEVDGARFRAVAPSAFYVPAGARHRFITRKAEIGSYCLGVLLGAESASARPAGARSESAP